MHVLAALVSTLLFASAAGARTAMFEAQLDIIAFGTNGPYTGSFTRHFHIPLGAICASSFPGGVSCGPTTVENGTPLTGAGTASVTGSAPAAFAIPQGGVAHAGFTGLFPTNDPTYLGTSLYGALSNDAVATPLGGAGFFAAGAGAGSLTHRYSPPSHGAARIVAGARRFGGVMGLLGEVRWFRELFLTPPVAGSRPIVSGLGPIGITPAIGRSNANTAGTTRRMFYYERGRYRSVAYGVVATGFRWTTGTAYAYDSVGRYASRFTLAGYDHRTPQGLGMIQLVTPFLAHWAMSPAPDHVAGVASLRVRFAPEPHAALLLAAGIGLLAALRVGSAARAARGRRDR